MGEKKEKVNMDEIKHNFETMLEKNNEKLLNGLLTKIEENIKVNDKHYEQQVDSLTKENKELTELNNKLKDEIEKIKKNENEACEKIADYENELTLKNNDVNESQKIIESYEKKYAMIESVQKLYNKLPKKDQECIKNIFPSDETILFIGQSARWDNVDQMWEYVRSKVLNEGLRETDSYNDMLKSMFEIYNICNPKRKHLLMDALIGERYDSDKHVIIGIKNDGIIKQVLLPGVIDDITQKVEKKALVKVQV